MEDFQVFADLLEIPPKRLTKIYTNIFSSVEKINTLIETSFLTEPAKAVYKNNFFDRLRKRICYKIEDKNFAFESVISPLTDNFLIHNL